MSFAKGNVLKQLQMDGEFMNPKSFQLSDSGLYGHRISQTSLFHCSILKLALLSFTIVFNKQGIEYSFLTFES